MGGGNVGKTILLLRRGAGQVQVGGRDALALALGRYHVHEDRVVAIGLELGSVNRQGSLEGALGHAVGGEHNLLDGVAGGLTVSLGRGEENLDRRTGRNIEVGALHTNRRGRAQIHRIGAQGNRGVCVDGVHAGHRHECLGAQGLLVRLVVVFRDGVLEGLHHIGSASLQGARGDVQARAEAAVNVAHVLAEEGRVVGELCLGLGQRGTGRLAGGRVNGAHGQNQRLVAVVGNVLESSAVHGDRGVCRSIHSRSAVAQGRGRNRGNGGNLQLGASLARRNPAVLVGVAVAEHHVEGGACCLKEVGVHRCGELHGAVRSKGGGGHVLGVVGVAARVMRRESDALTLGHDVKTERLIVHELGGESGAVNGDGAALEDVEGAGGDLQVLRVLCFTLLHGTGYCRGIRRGGRHGRGERQEHRAGKGEGATALHHILREYETRMALK